MVSVSEWVHHVSLVSVCTPAEGPVVTGRLSGRCVRCKAVSVRGPASGCSCLSSRLPVVVFLRGPGHCSRAVCLHRCQSVTLGERFRMGLPRYACRLSGSGWVSSGLAQCARWCPCPLGFVLGQCSMWVTLWASLFWFQCISKHRVLSVDAGPAGRGSDMKGTLLPAMGSACA